MRDHLDAHGRRPAFTAAIVVVAACALLAGPASHKASAATALPPAVEENFDSVYAFLEAGGRPQGRERVACDATCQYLVDRTFPPPTSPPGPSANPSELKRVGSGLYRLRVKVRHLPGPAKVGLVGALAAANAVVWRQVGTDAGRLFFGVEVPAQPTPAITHVRLVDEGQRVLHSSATIPALDIYAPENGMIGRTSAGADVWEDGGTGRCTYYGTIADPTFGGFGALIASGVGACGGPGTITYAYSYRPGIPAYLTPDPQPTTQPPVDWPRSGEGTNGEPVETTRDRARAELENDPDQYGSVIARIDCLLGGDSVDPTGLCIKIPSCHGETYETCRTRLQDAGFTGTITKHTLSADDAIMEEQADRVTATSPAHGTQTEHDTTITVYVNPETMPQMTATQTLIAETLNASDPNEITDSNKKTIARQCERRATAQGSGRSVSDCLDPSLPIYVVGREHPEASDHTIDALKSYAPWVLLTYADRERPSGWPNNYPETDPGGAQKCVGKFLVTACDEWPWIKTEEGGPKPGPIPPSAHLRIINNGQNSGSGSKYRYFLDACRIRERKALPTPLNGGGRFLVIPVPKGAPTSTPSLNLCHGTNP